MSYKRSEERPHTDSYHSSAVGRVPPPQLSSYLDDFISGLETLDSRRRARLHRRHEDTRLVPACETDTDRALLLETDEPRVRPTGARRSRLDGTK